MKTINKRLLLVVVITLFVVMLTSCSGNADIEPPAGAANGAEMQKITGTCEVGVTESTVVVKSDADIVDGAKVALTVNGTDGKTLAEKIIVKSGDNLSAEFAIQPDWDSYIYGFLVMTVDSYGKQPDDVIDLYGSRFEKIEMEDLLYNADSYFLVIRSEKTSIK